MAAAGTEAGGTLPTMRERGDVNFVNFDGDNYLNRLYWPDESDDGVCPHCEGELEEGVCPRCEEK